MANRLTRRNFLVSTAAASGVVIGSSALAACGGNEESGSSTTAAGGGGAAANTLSFDNWTLYIDKPNDDLFGEGGTLAEFQKATGIKVDYTEGINDNNELFAKIQPLLSKGDPIGSTIIAPTFWMAGRLLQLGWLDKLPLAQIPNAANLIPSLEDPPSDPTGEYSLPWQSGMAGIAYNQAVTGRELTTMDDLWDPAFRGKIGMLTEMRDTIGLIAMSLGIDLA
ncbi:MAG: ABC transporter substrate-binding protein, partial [Microthrixaceae bacterium]